MLQLYGMASKTELARSSRIGSFATRGSATGRVLLSCGLPDILRLASFVAVHLVLFGVVQLYIFRRYDFISMNVFRITYYAYWHVAWGYLHLHRLF